MSVPYRPLGIIAGCFEACGHNISHMYDDLLFFEHNAFLVQMGEEGKDLFLVFNEESEPGERERIAIPIIDEGKKNGLDIVLGGLYRLTADEEGENLQLAFLEE